MTKPLMRYRAFCPECHHVETGWTCDGTAPVTRFCVQCKQVQMLIQSENKLILNSVYTDEQAQHVTMLLFLERQQNPYLSHADHPPTWQEQQSYVASRPYPYWYAACDPTIHDYVGACWVDQKQSGIYVLNRYHRRGYGTEIMRQLMAMHPEMPYTAYIHPENVASIRLHEKLGFRVDHTDDNGQLVLKHQKV